ncbi:transposase [Pseudanabaena yagii]|uniref:transposase n=1 Tax=Pseudanabaena yagii TaxID=2661615 RepID=UPI001CEDF20B|nr:transposase [Pseudanabaena yagii]
MFVNFLRSSIFWLLFIHATKPFFSLNSRLLANLKYPLRRLQKILVDKGFSGEDITQWVKDNFSYTWEVSKRAEAQKGFVVESKRWVVERTFAWIDKYRRLSKDYEFYENISESFIYIALIRKMLKNLTAVNS